MLKLYFFSIVFKFLFQKIFGLKYAKIVYTQAIGKSTNVKSV
jgi:hypothetical protein